MSGIELRGRNGGDWTAESVEALKKHWTDGLSASQAARALNTEFHGTFTRCSVIGKVRRLGLEKRATTVRDPRYIPTKHYAPQADAAPELIPQEDPIVLEGGKLVTLLDLTSAMCRWPTGDPREPDFHFCGHRKTEGSPYCRAHAAKAYQPAARRVTAEEREQARALARLAGQGRAFG